MSGVVIRGTDPQSGGRFRSFQTPLSSWRKRRGRRSIYSLIGAFLLSSGALLGGYNSLLGQAFACLVNAALLAFLLAVSHPTIQFWRSIAPMSGVGLLAGLWLWAVHGAGLAGSDSYAPDLLGVELLGYLAGLMALLCGALLGRKQGGTELFLRWLVIFNLLWMLVGLAARSMGADDLFEFWRLSRQGRFAGTMGNANVTAALAGAMALIVAGRLLEELGHRRPLKWARLLLLAAPLLLFIAVMVATASRVAVIIFMGLLLVMLLRAGSRSIARSNRTRAVLHGGRLFIALALLPILIVVGPILLERFSSMGADTDMRLDMFQHYGDLALQAPLYGYGPGAFASVNVHFLSNIELGQLLWSVNSAHNIVLQLLLVGGVPYLLLIVMAASFVSGPILLNLVEEGLAPARMAPVLALVMILLCAMVDIALDVPAVAIQFLAISGLLWGRALCLRDSGAGYLKKFSSFMRTCRQRSIRGT